MSDLKEVGEPLPRELSMILESIYIAAGVGCDIKSRIAYVSERLLQESDVHTSCMSFEDHLKALEYHFGMKMRFLCVAVEA